MINFKEYQLSEVAEWLTSDSPVQIPAFQRGLVWAPKQVELLWDSLLRVFPIGSFIFSKWEKSSGRDDESVKYDLMDGQQRVNAISLGYREPDEDARAVLWLDVEPEILEKSTRQFLVRVTTDAHPWGYEKDDECSRLNTDDKRKALKSYELSGKSIYNDSFSLRDTWPYQSTTPIPLYCFLLADTSDADTFCDSVIELAKQSRFKKCNKIDFDSKRTAIKNFYPAFNKLIDYRVSCTILSQEVIKDGNEYLNSISPLEVLFNRLNTGGTLISKEDLTYSAIKAYWPEIKQVNDELAARYMAPSKLVILVFRLALSLDGEYFKDSLNVKEIRTRALDTDTKFRCRILRLYEQLDNILRRIDNWLGVNDSDCKSKTPAVLRTSIVNRSPDVYLLLMYLAQRDIEMDLSIDSSYIKALAFILHWFHTDKQGVAVRIIFKKCQADNITVDNIKRGISQAQHDCSILPIYSPDSLRKKYENKTKWAENWSLDTTDSALYKHLFNRIFWYATTEAKEMLLYAQRAYLNANFSNYDPARKDLWETYNRPWDYDHIVPKAYIVNKRGKAREFCKKWLWSIGNFAAISFEANRGKGVRFDYSEYESNKDSLLFDYSKYECLEHNIKNITYDEDLASRFASVTFGRACQIYQITYDMIKCLIEKPVLSHSLNQRAELMQQIISLLPGAKAYFATEDMMDFEVGEFDWSREWIGVGIVKGDYYACFEWNANISADGSWQGEIGIRKRVDRSIALEKRVYFDSCEGLDNYEKYTDNPWWFVCRDYKATGTDVKSLSIPIVEELKNLCGVIDNIIAAETQKQ